MEGVFRRGLGRGGMGGFSAESRLSVRGIVHVHT